MRWMRDRILGRSLGASADATAEYDDVHDDAYGEPCSALYRPYEPDFAKARVVGSKAFDRLSKRYGAAHVG